MKNLKLILICVLINFSTNTTSLGQNIAPSSTQNFLSQEISNSKAHGVNFLNISPFSIDESYNKEIALGKLTNNFEKAKMLKINNHVINKLLTETHPAIVISLPKPGGGTFTLELVEFKVLSDNFQAYSMVDTGKLLLTNIPAMKHYRGNIQGKPNSVVVMSFSKEESSGIISSPELSGNIVLGKLVNQNAYIVYNDTSINSFLDFDCTWKDPEGQKEQTDGQKKKKQTNSKANVGCIEVALDISKSIRNTKSSNNQTISFATANFAQVITLFASENITLNLHSVIVWNTQESFTNDLPLYNTYRNNNVIQGADLTQYLHFYGGGGLGYRDVLCNSAFNTSLAGIDNAIASTVPTFSWNAFIMAHELGHNFGSRHTHDCAWNGNNTPIDGCSQPVGGCSGNYPIPPSGGTIMSYCHITNVGINLSFGFGQQPGAVIQSGASSCPGSCSLESLCTGPTNVYTITAKHSNQALDVAASNYTNGRQLIQWPYSGTQNQFWYIDAISGFGNDLYIVRAKQFPNKVLTEEFTTSSQRKAMIYDFFGWSTQGFFITPSSSGYYNIESYYSGKLLEIPSSSNANGAKAVFNNSTGGNNQQWKFNLVSGNCPGSNSGSNSSGSSNLESLITNLKNPEGSHSVGIYPNPNSNQELYISTSQSIDKAEISIYDLNGRIVLQKLQQFSKSNKLDLPLLPKGLYLIKISPQGANNDKIIYKKLEIN